MNQVYTVKQVYTVNNGYELVGFGSSFYLPTQKPGGAKKFNVESGLSGYLSLALSGRNRNLR
jgi:hypothetical protein